MTSIKACVRPSACNFLSTLKQDVSNYHSSWFSHSALLDLRENIRDFRQDISSSGCAYWKGKGRLTVTACLEKAYLSLLWVCIWIYSSIAQASCAALHGQSLLHASTYVGICRSFRYMEGPPFAHHFIQGSWRSNLDALDGSNNEPVTVCNCSLAAPLLTLGTLAMARTVRSFTSCADVHQAFGISYC